MSLQGFIRLVYEYQYAKDQSSTLSKYRPNKDKDWTKISQAKHTRRASGLLLKTSNRMRFVFHTPGYAERKKWIK